MRLASYNMRGRPSFGAVVGEGIVDLRSRLSRFPTLLDLFRAQALDEAKSAVAGVRPDVPDDEACQVVFAGVGIPLLAATLAQRLRCPGLTILFEGGVIGAFIEPGKLPPSTNDQRCTIRANMVLGSAEVLLLLQRGYVDVGFLGGAQIDQFGNLNSIQRRAFE